LVTTAADSLRQDSAVADPIAVLRAACAGAPGRPEPLIALARALLSADRAAEAVIPAERAAALAPGLAAARETREAVLAVLLAGDPALVKLELAAALNPGDAASQLALGEAYAALDRPHDAERHFKAALALKPGCGPRAELGALYLGVGMAEAAEHYARAALASEDLASEDLASEDHGAADDAFVAMAHQTLASLAEAAGDLAASARHLDLAYARQSLFRQPAADSPFTTLVLVTREAGNVPYRSLLPPLRFDCAVWYMEHARLEQIADLPPYAVVLNAIGDPDVAMASRERVEAFLARCQRPVLNDPARVRATFRHRLGDTLAGLDDVVAPLTARLSAQDIAAHGVAACVRQAGLAGGPVILRPAGSHGGAGMVLIADDQALDAATLAPGLDAYVSRFHDYRSPDGFYRKYRVIFVDRQAFPYHLAIGPRWMVHHQSADMAHDAARIAEELRFLRDPAGAIGARAMAAVEAIGRRLDLDYGGLDFTVTADGRVLAFEANATMLAHLEPLDGPFAAKNPFIQPIMDAFQARLAILARSP
jgi:tetratricopeptide (TPR) repeat protein